MAYPDRFITYFLKFEVLRILQRLSVSNIHADQHSRMKVLQQLTSYVFCELVQLNNNILEVEFEDAGEGDPRGLGGRVLVLALAEDVGGRAGRRRRHGAPRHAREQREHSLRVHGGEQGVDSHMTSAHGSGWC